MANDCDDRLGRKAVSPLIATVLVTLLTVVALGLTLTVVTPTFNRARDTAVINDEFNTLATVDAAVKEVASEPDGSRRVVPITITDGMMRTDTTNDWMYFEYTPTEALDLSGTKGIAHIERGLEFAEYFGSYADGAKATPAWTNMSGQAVASSGAYSITNGTSYHNITSSIANWQFSATIANISGTTGGQVFALPTNPESLVGYWTMDEGNGNMAYDWSGNRNNGTLTLMNTTGNATSGWQSDESCKSGNCLRFDGYNDYVEMVHSNSLEPASISVSAWVNLSSDGTRHIVLAKWTGYTLEVSSDGYPLFQINNNEGQVGTTSISTIGWNQWHHIVGTFDNSTFGIRIYVDGVQTRSNELFSQINYGHTVLRVSNTLYGGGAVNGTIDEVMIFNRSLSTSEIAALYETSAKKLLATGTQTITAKMTPSIVLSNPAGQTKFDDVLVTSVANDKLTLLVPYDNIDISGSLRLSKGSYSVQVRHVDTNSTTNKPIIELMAV
ncbi:MAG: LamG domain-containing protein [Candidatus Aenigmarchaeota archaeon]|nr:LamG domain-containing protein [Candidatus Aenigmarchaeota archaeon]